MFRGFRGFRVEKGSEGFDGYGNLLKVLGFEYQDLGFRAFRASGLGTGP